VAGNICCRALASGYMNAIVFWFDLHMDEEETITTAPAGVGKGGVLLEEEDFEAGPGGWCPPPHASSTLVI